MDNMTKEILQEKYEVLSRAVDDTTYILMDNDNLTEDELEDKINIRFDRICSEIECIRNELDNYFKSTLKTNIIESGILVD